MLFHRAVSKVLQSSLNFSVFLFVLPPNQGIRIQKKRPIPEQKSGIGRYFKAYLVSKKIGFYHEINFLSIVSIHLSSNFIIFFAKRFVIESSFLCRQSHALQFFESVCCI